MSLLYNEVYITTAPDFKSRARTTSPSGETRGFEPVTNEFSVRRSHHWANRSGTWIVTSIVTEQVVIETANQIISFVSNSEMGLLVGM